MFPRVCFCNAEAADLASYGQENLEIGTTADSTDNVEEEKNYDVVVFRAWPDSDSEYWNRGWIDGQNSVANIDNQQQWDCELKRHFVVFKIELQIWFSLFKKLQ